MSDVLVMGVVIIISIIVLLNVASEFSKKSQEKQNKMLVIANKRDDNLIEIDRDILDTLKNIEKQLNN